MTLEGAVGCEKLIKASEKKMRKPGSILYAFASVGCTDASMLSSLDTGLTGAAGSQSVDMRDFSAKNRSCFERCFGPFGSFGEVA